MAGYKMTGKSIPERGPGVKAVDYMIASGGIRTTGTRWFSSASRGEPKKTALYDLHVAQGGKMVQFGGHLLPVDYGRGSAEQSHLWTRSHASLFDVSHMLQTHITGKHALQYFESLCTADLSGMTVGTGCLSLFTDPSTGVILDDLIVMKTGENSLYVVTNATRRQHDTNLMSEALEHWTKRMGKEAEVRFSTAEELSLVAVQGPLSSNVVGNVLDDKHRRRLERFYFMSTMECSVAGVEGCRLTRCGYTGEDGFEISVPSEQATNVVQELLHRAQGQLRLAGLAPRDSLRLEAGLCLYGSDIDETTTPVAAGLMWTIGKRRKRNGDFPGAKVILEEARLKTNKRTRVGLMSERGVLPPARKDCLLVNEEADIVGYVTSGAPSISIPKANIAMAYLDTAFVKPPPNRPFSEPKSGTF